MSRSSLALVTPPVSEPVTVGEVKSWLRIDDNSEDATLVALVTTARMAAEEYLRRSLITQSWRMTLNPVRSRALDDLPAGVYDLPVNYFDGALATSVVLPRGPIQSITTVTTYGLDDVGTVYDPVGYRLDANSGRLLLTNGATWPGSLRAYGAADVVYVAGYGPQAKDVPQPIRTAILIHVAALYEQRGMCESSMDLPPGAKQLLNQYRVVSL